MKNIDEMIDNRFKKIDCLFVIKLVMFEIITKYYSNFNKNIDDETN